MESKKFFTTCYDVFMYILMAILGSLLSLGLAIETPSVTWKVVYGTLFVLYAVTYFFCVKQKKNPQKVWSVIMATLGVTVMSAICSLFKPVTMWAELMEVELLVLFFILFLIAIEAIRKDAEDRAIKIAIAIFFGAPCIGGIISMIATYYQFEELVVMGGVIDVNAIPEIMAHIAIAALFVVFSLVDIKLIKASNGLLGATASIATTLLLIKLIATWLLGLFSLAMPHWIDVLFMIGIGLPGAIAIILFILLLINKARE